MYLGHLEGVDNLILTGLIKHFYSPLTKQDDPPSGNSHEVSEPRSGAVVKFHGFRENSLLPSAGGDEKPKKEQGREKELGKAFKVCLKQL